MLPDPDRAGATRLRILVIDDSRETAESYALLAQEMGHLSAFATNGDAALDLAARMRPDIVLLDLVLPDIEGHDLALQLRALPGMEHARIYVVSGYGTDDERRRSREVGCAGHFVKPLAADVFESLLRG